MPKSNGELTQAEQNTLKKVGKRPQKAADIAGKLGHSSHHGAARALGSLERKGLVQKSDKGYSKV